MNVTDWIFTTAGVIGWIWVFHKIFFTDWLDTPPRRGHDWRPW